MIKNRVRWETYSGTFVIQNMHCHEIAVLSANCVDLVKIFWRKIDSSDKVKLDCLILTFF